MWSALDTSGLAQWIQISSWSYPTLLSIHGLGMSVVVGLTMVVALRILGFPRGVPLGAYKQTLPYFVVAFFFNFISGAMLFVADATSLAMNPSFQIKIVAIVVGLLVVWRMYAGAVAPAARLEYGREGAGVSSFTLPRDAKPLAVISLLIWSVSVIVSGRLVAYLSAF